MLELLNLTKIFGSGVVAIEDVSLVVNQGSFLTILGPSGCGKSTLLRLIAGLEIPTTGSIRLDTKDVVGPGPDRCMVFQDYSSFPWLTVEQNVEFGLRAQGVGRAKREQSIESVLNQVGLWEFRKAMPGTLSGGMQQRVAIARSLVVRPRMLLMDEPFGALDAETRDEMRDLIMNVWQQQQITVIFVTHEIEEALFLGNRLIISGPRPFHIVRDISIPFQYPRSGTLRTSSGFISLRNEVAITLKSIRK